jgi:hypothetical protein
MQPYWERVDEYGALLRLGPGDSVAISITTEIGMSREVSTQMAKSFGISLDSWSVRAGAGVTRTTGLKLQVTGKQSITFTRTFANSDPQRRERFLTFWRPAARFRVYELQHLRVVGTGAWNGAEVKRNFAFLWENPAAAHLWKGKAEASAFLSGHLEFSDLHR